MLRANLCLFIFGFSFCYSINTCTETANFRHFYKIKSCSRSKERVIGRKHSLDLKDCLNYAREKDGFALNFGPLNVVDEYYNCHVLGCPEFSNLTTLVNDTQYDYYSSYANLKGKPIILLFSFTSLQLFLQI